MLTRGSSPFGMAVRVGSPAGKWGHDAAVYALCPRPTFNCGGYLMPVQFVVVADWPSEREHGPTETTAFACTGRDGKPFFDEARDRDSELLDRSRRVPGRAQHDAVLASLEQGYGTVGWDRPLPGHAARDREELDRGNR